MIKIDPAGQITIDLMDKIADDVTRAMKRTLAIAPSPLLPIAMNGGAVAVGIIAAVLAQMAGTYDASAEPDEECILLAALLCARVAINPGQGVEHAYRDLETLRASERSKAEPCA